MRTGDLAHCGSIQKQKQDRDSSVDLIPIYFFFINIKTKIIYVKIPSMRQLHYKNGTTIEYNLLVMPYTSRKERNMHTHLRNRCLTPKLFSLKVNISGYSS